MNDRDRQAAIYALRQARQGIDVALSMLETVEQSQACQHPEEKRQDLRGMSGGPEHYYCTTCGTEVDRRGEEARPGGRSPGEPGGAEEVPGAGGSELPD